MNPIEIIEKCGYRILRYEYDLWKAVGSGISGEIFFCPGPKAPCKFMATVPKGRGCICGESGKASVLEWRDDDGTIYKCPEAQCCRSILQSAHATAPVTARFTAISSGSKPKGYFRPKDKDGNISIEALYLALITAPEKPEFIREELLESVNQHPKTKFGFKDNWVEDSPFYGSAYDNFEKGAEIWILAWIRIGGSRALREAANLLEKIESKMRKLEKSETDFLAAVNEAATVIFDVPTQKSVREIWIKQQAGRNEKQFRDVRDRLGFAWMPTATRGKNAH